MKPVSPVFPSRPDLPEVIVAKDQPEYIPLPSVRASCGDNGPIVMVSRIRMTWTERFRLFIGGSFWIMRVTGDGPTQPFKIFVQEPQL